MTTTDYISKHENLIRIANSICKNPDLANDLVQELYVKLIEAERKHGDLDHLSNNEKPNLVWCWLVLRNAWIDLNRAERHLHYVQIDCEYVDTTEEVNERERLLDDVENAFKAMRNTDAELYSAAYFRLYIKSGLSYNALAEINNTTKWVVQRAVQNGKRIILNKLNNDAQ